MFGLDCKLLIDEKMNQLFNGHSAFAESTEVIRLLERKVTQNELNVYVDQTDFGCWFIPDK
ncbi:hypothetical protein [Salirhabdus salicampi]|uniref:hypothetical protein n=1 Tax=Salirhabdus salicampi TaxID=476102 RepID=UPI0020C2AC08|nr:hypothetical protein [Salirhabdus salicampi]MCP8617108.1 hypothetical protein [Salirhabdus salicampi]